MKVKELIQALSKYPDDMEVLVTGDMGMGVIDETDFEVEKLNLVQYHEYNGRPMDFQEWEFPESYHREIIKTEKVLIIH